MRTKQDTKKLLLEAALLIANKTSGEQLGMAQIAAAAGVSRQAAYLHFQSKASLLSATWWYLDAKLGIQDLLDPAINAKTGIAKLKAFIKFWAGYVPQAFPIMSALWKLQSTDQAAADVCNERTLWLKDACRDAVSALESDGFLAGRWSKEKATDLCCQLLSFENWRYLTQECQWSDEEYCSHITYIVTSGLVGVE